MTPDLPRADLSTGFRGLRALVTGASGFIGRWVARSLTQVGADVTVGVRDSAAFHAIARRWSIRADVMTFDATSQASVTELVRSARPDVVFNLAGYGVDRSELHTDLMIAINEKLVRHLAIAVADLKPSARWSGRRLVHTGSALEYGVISGVATEDGPAEPHTDYGRTKLAGTLALSVFAADSGLPCLTARLFTVYGPGEHPGRLLPTLIEAARDEKPVRLSGGTQRRDFAYVEDGAEGLLRLAATTGSAGEVVNLATGRMTSVRDFATTASEVLALPTDRLLFGAELPRPDEMRITGVDTDRLMSLTNWRPPADLAVGIRRAMNFELARDSHTQFPAN